MRLSFRKKEVEEMSDADLEAISASRWCPALSDADKRPYQGQ